jgi:hypothetical protein
MSASESSVVRTMSWTFGVLIGGMWMGEVLLGNLGGTSVLGNLRDFHPRVHAMAPRFALGAVGLTALAGLVAAYRTGSIGAALRVGVWSRVISGAITFATLVGDHHPVSWRHDAGCIEYPRICAQRAPFTHRGRIVPFPLLGRPRRRFEPYLDRAHARNNCGRDRRHHRQVNAQWSGLNISIAAISSRPRSNPCWPR